MERSKSDLNIEWVANPTSFLTFSGVFSQVNPSVFIDTSY
jgi:hypothetical protein